LVNDAQVLCALANTLLIGQMFYQLTRNSNGVRTALITAIYGKVRFLNDRYLLLEADRFCVVFQALRITRAAKQAATTGETVRFICTAWRCC
jgi:hypothetical protein